MKRWIDFPGTNCPVCGGDPIVLTESLEYNLVYDGDEVKCNDCSHTGFISVEDSECADIIWDDEEEELL